MALQKKIEKKKKKGIKEDPSRFFGGKKHVKMTYDGKGRQNILYECPVVGFSSK